MKRRVRKIVNFFAFNLLFFALYLNFIHKDKAVVDANVSTNNSAVVMTGTVPVENPEKYLGQTTQPVSAAQQTFVEKQEPSSALKLTIN